MYMTSLFGENLLDDLMRFPTFREVEEDAGSVLMRTDIKEKDDQYILAVDLPGMTKENLKLHLKDGYLTIEAERGAETAKEEGGKFLRRERYIGSCKRSFVVDKHLTEEDIKAKYVDGVLTISFPKEVKKPVEEKKYIAIEG